MADTVSFPVVDQAINTLKKVNEYINAGMDTTIDVAQDLVENDKVTEVSSKKVMDLRNIMLDFTRMDRDLQQFRAAVELVKRQCKKGAVEDMEELLDEKLAEIQAENTDEELKQDEKYTDFEQKIRDILHPEEGLPSQAQPTQVDDDIAVMQEVNTKCPYTGKEMTHPVRNIHCGHHYEKEGITQLMKNRKGRAKCPVGGCVNDKPITASDLEDDKELKRYIERKNRQATKRQKHAAIMV
ncbi:hypothetical protein NP493_1317g00059 [Ridgeia piscesae]|uniref:E3 SUMO-protein ligase NSE2 n=1 Tax=Ridgeia piscesae TaxID=27915 RepID=A0AAD9K8P6_RIDPI|nr:hypothetical protein NP493_1317g00059 [Ridgeia piscesae]